jgi:ABC-2 type transport system ATP-binding protein
VIDARGLTKRYGQTLAVDDLSFTVEPGIVTGFLGPNGAGKSTTMRMILGLDSPSAGSVTVNGKPYAEHKRPLSEVGALLEARAIHSGRSARNHLLAMAATTGIGRRRVEEVINLVGLHDVAGQRVGKFSLGMGQRLGIGAALLADPQTLILDEPVNGLDPDGVRWIRTLLTGLASEGRTVFLSSHLMSEMALTADHVIVVGRGRLLKDQAMEHFIADASADRVHVRAPRALELTDLLRAAGATVTTTDSATLDVEHLAAELIGTIAADAGIALFQLTTQSASLEEAYMALTEDAVTHRALAYAEPARIDRLDQSTIGESAA